jgi:hypothetical protein
VESSCSTETAKALSWKYSLDKNLIIVRIVPPSLIASWKQIIETKFIGLGFRV